MAATMRAAGVNAPSTVPRRRCLESMQAAAPRPRHAGCARSRAPIPDRHDLPPRPPAPHRCRRRSRPQDAIRAAHEAIGRADDEIRAFVHVDVDAPAPAPRGRCAASPSAVKDIIDTADMPTEMGSPIYAGWRPKADAPIVTALAPRRRDADRQDRDDAVRPSRPDADAQSAQSRPHAGRLVVGVGGGGRAPAWCRSRSAPRPAARSSARPRSAAAPAIKPSYRLLPTRRRQVLLLGARHGRPVRRDRARRRLRARRR